MADTVWFQIGGLFDGFLHQMSLYGVFTVFTSLMSLFLVISFQTKAFGFVPPTLWVGFLRGVINSQRNEGETCEARAAASEICDLDFN